MTFQEIEAIPIYFILAKGRSGTTLLQTMIDAHPNTAAPTESRFLVHFQHKYRHTKRWTPEKKNAFIEDVIQEQKIALFWNLDKERLRQYLDIIPEDASYGIICKAVYLSFISIFSKDRLTCIVDKNPVYSWLIPILLDIIPNAKFIHLIRDPRACVNSTIKFRTKSAKSVARSWSTNNHYIEKFKSLKKENYFTLHYEDMIQKPQESMQNISLFLGLPYSPQMLTYHKQVQVSIGTFLSDGDSEKTNNIRKEGFEKIHKNLAKPLDPSRIDSWKSKLTKEQIELTSTITHFLLKKYGYEDEVKSKNSPVYLSQMFNIYKTQLYYRLPIWLRELKSKPQLTFMNNEQ